jgi:hypothetical protein
MLHILVGLLGGGSAHRQDPTYAGKHHTEKTLVYIRGHIQNFPDRVDNEIDNNNN